MRAAKVLQISPKEQVLSRNLCLRPGLFMEPPQPSLCSRCSAGSQQKIESPAVSKDQDIELAFSAKVS